MSHHSWEGITMTTIKEETCPKCNGKLVETGLSNCWPYEKWECMDCDTKFEVELVRDWENLEEVEK